MDVGVILHLSAFTWLLWSYQMLMREAWWQGTSLMWLTYISNMAYGTHPWCDLSCTHPWCDLSESALELTLMLVSVRIFDAPYPCTHHLMLAMKYYQRFGISEASLMWLVRAQSELYQSDNPRLWIHSEYHSKYVQITQCWFTVCSIIKMCVDNSLYKLLGCCHHSNRYTHAHKYIIPS